MERTVEGIKQAITKLPQNKLRQFRAWYEKFDSDVWDKQIENDVASERLDALADKAIVDHKKGKSKKI